MPTIRFPLLLLVCLMLVIGGAGYSAFDQMQQDEAQKIRQNLAAVADLKIGQITEWLAQNKNTAVAASRGSELANLADQWIRSGKQDGALKQSLARRLQFIGEQHSYGELALLDVTGRPLLTTDNDLKDISVDSSLAQLAIARKRLSIGKMHWDVRPHEDPYVSLPMAIPLTLPSESEPVIGALWIELNAHHFLFPLIQKWPAQSESAETLLVKNEGGHVLYLNELKYRKDKPLGFRISADHPTALAAQAVRGATGFVSGTDYRGEPVIGYAAPIPGTDWLMIAKVDEKEVVAPIRQLALNVALVSALLLAVVSLSLFFWWRQRIIHYRAAYLEAELQQQRLSLQYQSLSRYANDIVLLLDETGKIIEANERAETAYGYTREGLLGKNIRHLRARDEQETLESQFESVKNSNSILFEGMHVRSDGSLFPVEVSCRAIRMDEDMFIQSIIRDISERKAGQERERRLTNLYRALSATNEAIIHAESEEALFSMVCQTAIEHGGMVLAWIGVPNEQHLFVPVARSGRAASYLNDITISTLASEPSGQGPCGTAYREGRSVVASDYVRDYITKPWAEKARQYGICSASAYPVRRAGKPFAVLSVYSTHPHVFDSKVVRLLEQMTANIGYALDNFSREAGRKRAEKALQKSEQRYRELFETMQESFFVLEAITDEKGNPVDWRYVETNPQTERYMQMTREELVGRTYGEVVPDPDPTWINLLGTVALTGRAISQEQYAQTRNRWLQVHAYSPRPGYAAVLFTDITERKQAEEALRHSEAHLKTFYNSSLIGVISWNLDGQITGANDKFLEMIGYTRDDLESGRIDWIGMTPPEYKEGDEKAVAELMAKGFHGAVEKEYVRKDGSRIAVAVTSALLDAATLDGVGFVLDITERMKAKQDLARATVLLAESQSIARVGGWEIDLENGRLFWTEETYRIHDLDPGEYQPTVETAIQFYAPESAPVIARAVQDAIELKQPFDLELKLVTAKGRHICVHANCSITEENGKVKRITGAFQDITDRKQAEEDLKLAAMVYRDNSEAMMVTDDDGHIIAVNPAFEQITGYPRDEVIGKTPRLLKSGRHDAKFYKKIWAELDVNGRWKGELWNKKKNGELFAVQLTINTIRNEDGSPHRYVSLLSDITEKKQSEDLIWSQANFDALTGLPNRRLFRDRLQHEMHNAQRSHLPVALMFLDLDGFKDVNDSLGHDMGDVLLKTAAERLSNCVRKTDTVARLGGDEFTVILTEVSDLDNVERVARHILRTLSEPIKLGDEVAYVSASVGITLYPNDGEDIETLVKNADQAMYAAKQAGKNRYNYFTSSMQEAVMQRVRLINDLRTALERNQFEIVYQPIIELATGNILKAEALIRWHHPTKGLVNPVDFISTAEDTGMISSFGNWIFHEAARQAARWRERFHPGFQISVNISPMQFRNNGIDPSVWFNHLRELGLPGEGIVVEITEGLLLDAHPRVMEQLLLLRDAGIEVALDDFGTGYSSLAYLKRFDIDYIKIDQTFVQNLEADSNDMVLCEAMIAMAHKLGIRVIAEGVETGRQHELLANGGCDFAQGFLFSRPMSGDIFEILLRRNPFSYQESFNI